MKNEQEVFISNVKRIRNEKKITQMQLAEKACLSAGLIGELELGRRNPSLATIVKIAGALQVPVYSLFYDNDSDEEFFQKLKKKEEIKENIMQLLDEMEKI